MGRALHVSRSLPPIISSARIVTSIEKPNCLSPSPESALSDCNNGDLSLHSRLYPNIAFSPSPTRQSALGPKFMSRVRHNIVLARSFSSITELSESEWPETDDDYVTDSGHCMVTYQDRGSMPVVLEHHEHKAFETETETDAEAFAGTLTDLHCGSRSHRLSAQREQVQQAVHLTEAETDADTVTSSYKEDEQLCYGTKKGGTCFETESDTDSGSHRLSARRKQVWQVVHATETETDADSIASISDEEVHLDHRESNYEACDEMECGTDGGSRQLFTDWQAGFATESETDADIVSSTSNEVKHLHHGRHKFGLHHQNLVETDKNEHLHGGRLNFGSRHGPAECEQVQRIRQATTETDLETDMAMETDETENLNDEKIKMYDPEGGYSSEAGWSSSETDHLQEQRQGDHVSETEVTGSDLSHWAETDEKEPLQLWKGDADGVDTGSSTLTRGLERPCTKERSASRSTRYDEAPDRSRGRDRGLERPSKKERSSGLSPRTMRDDDSDEVEIESDLEGELQEEIERQMAADQKVERPSITWGILLTKDIRQEARQNVLKYLETEGIETAELARIELPSKVDVMQTRLGFLRKIGLDNDAINNYPLILGCSVQKNMVPVLKYLKKLGFPQAWVSMVLKKYPMILHASVVIDILPVIYFLRGLDIDADDLPRVILRYPDVLGFKTEGTMSTSVAYLVSMGVSLRLVGHMLTEHPEILGMRVASVIKPRFEYLMSLGIPQLIVAKILARRPHVLGYDVEKRMQSNVNLLLELGVKKEAISGMVAQFPEILGRFFAHFVRDRVKWFQEHLEVDSDGVARMIEMMPQVVLMPIGMAHERIRFLKSELFSSVEVGSMVSQCPQILVSSITDSLRPNLTFLTREMKRPRTEVLEFPTFFTYSLRARIRPRFQALTDKDAHCSLDWLLNCSDLEFQKRLKAGFVSDEGLGLKFVMGGLLPRKPALEEKA
ncbi:hypothetical protein L7F22_007658 [Adiantum nelumboides]|nr:hypothetical protein [Adiantum nelumboides]